MILGKVTGSVVATEKHYKLEGRKLLLVQPLGLDLRARGEPILAVDGVGAGEGDRVLVVVEGRSAAMVSGRAESPLDAAVVAVVDHVELAP
ncbi:MAG TPA: EutN/CcmL family microcompartment protein [Vicinamibacteria bacterium]|nr:EutN/CcmL family microcompartment protein [Vicinamibacteria bacterium]